MEIQAVLDSRGPPENDEKDAGDGPTMVVKTREDPRGRCAEVLVRQTAEKKIAFSEISL